MKKLALIAQVPLDSFTGFNILRDIIRAFEKLGMHVEAFSLSTVNKTGYLYGYKQNQVNLPNPEVNNPVSLRIIEFFVLSTLGFKPRIELFGRSKRLTDALHRYNPDIIFLVGTLPAKTMIRYKREDPHVKVITYMDAPSNEFNFALTKSISSNNQSSLAIRYLSKFLKKNYLKYQDHLYSTLIDVSDAFVVPAKQHAKTVLKRFPNARGKIFTAMGSYVTKDKLIKRKRVLTIKKILFMSSYGSAQHTKAMDEIEYKIAPQFPEKEFIIHGHGCPERTSGNVKYSGKYLPLKKLFADIDLCICPLPAGNTGYKIKVFDYLTAGKIVIATTDAFLGFNAIDRYNAIVEDDISKYAGRIRELERNPKLMRKIQDNVYSALKGHYEKDALDFWSKILQIIEAP